MPSRSLFLVAAGVLCGLALLPTGSLYSQTRRPMTLVDLLNIPRVSDPQMAPDGKRITFTLATTDWPGNQRTPHLWRINVDGTQLRQLVAEAGAHNARWSPDGATVAFLLRGSVF